MNTFLQDLEGGPAGGGGGGEEGGQLSPALAASCRIHALIIRDSVSFL